MQSKGTIQRLLNDIKYKDWIFVLDEREDCFTIQIQFCDQCTVTGQTSTQYCRKWFVSEHMTDTEIIRTCFMAVEKAEYHELCEKFKFRDKLVANPHLDLEKIAGGIVDFDLLDQRKHPQV